MAGKKESSFFNMVSTLLLITAIAALSLGMVFNLTKEPIALAKKAKQEAAIKAVLPAFDELKIKQMKSAFEDDSLQFNLAFKDGQLVGSAINTFTKKGFSGNIKLMVGLLPDGTINNISVLEHKETPGLGDKMQKAKSPWSEQFNGKHPDSFNFDVTKDGGEVDAITAATISSRAYVDAVKRAVATYNENKEGI
ncbi:MAG: RnfABCDGE type electron transport complex subunit G [Bacteroidetes bacterium]|jgi:electron transport complex protein RnfG|nr:RnfABCDGE type electron transport complex subunit G [Bacteroidota bacterium]MBU1579727.1 RnfABCDGE type electron transport complex subunit G [Bacteroidota bacterium]MBU2466740.1 RnfABCDGE type electron transport complex subunit G [Bacteroidota bacterium]MBU2556401.1 RnfABCDGE type electron transport complex subunit G [Bacteroidota bacterium]MDA3943971.1 RnfABCDGE type electron transport complex subunit G [Bacteroidota bacterium]